ncbi:hypothetical protein RhiirA4_457747 [Rhizophagus irregularis]|uniref:Serine-enriched protein n=1 Tax=Rhizophagus irregularis TaxID=588596 RepID=A0A2I1GAN3_9GLOM|nr:hypothetical protein RhiirA4_457747 [Rhizophagus irregularis]
MSDLINVLLKDISQLYENSDDFDVNITVGEGDDVEIFKAHSVILRARSNYFRAALFKDWIKRKDNIIIFNKPNIKPKVFKILLKYFYTGTYSIEEENNQELILELLIAADELALTDLVENVQSYIINNKFNWVHQNLIQVYKTATTYDGFKIFREYCEELICGRPELFFESQDFISMDKSTLISIIKRDELELEEIEIWNNIIKWGISQEPQINSNLLELTRKDLNELKNRLDEILPHIRIFHITGNDFHEKIWPIKKILSKDLINQLIKFHIVKDSNLPTDALSKRSQKLDNSIIIKFQQADLLANWIDRNDDAYERKLGVSYEFQLLLCGSRDGMDMKTFRNLCGNKGPTLIIIKLRGSDQIIGGYNPLSWRLLNHWQATPESFIFSLNMKKNSYILSRVQQAYSSYAIKDLSNNGVSFGNDDLAFFNGACNKSYYEKRILDTTTFNMEDFEVFRVVKNK